MLDAISNIFPNCPVFSGVRPVKMGSDQETAISLLYLAGRIFASALLIPDNCRLQSDAPPHHVKTETPGQRICDAELVAGRKGQEEREGERASERRRKTPGRERGGKGCGL